MDTKEILSVYKSYVLQKQKYDEKNYEVKVLIESLVNVSLVYNEIRPGALLQGVHKRTQDTVLKLLKKYKLYYYIDKESYGDQVYFSKRSFTFSDISDYTAKGRFLGYDCGNSSNTSKFNVSIKEGLTDTDIFGYNCDPGDIDYVVKLWPSKIEQANKMLKKYGMLLSFSINFFGGFMPETSVLDELFNSISTKRKT